MHTAESTEDFLPVEASDDDFSTSKCCSSCDKSRKTSDKKAAPQKACVRRPRKKNYNLKLLCPIKNSGSASRAPEEEQELDRSAQRAGAAASNLISRSEYL
jgi:hypothetical protein